MTEPRKCPEPGCGLQMYVKRSHWDAKTQTYDLVEWECPRERFQCDPHELAALRSENQALRKRNEEFEQNINRIKTEVQHIVGNHSYRCPRHEELRDLILICDGGKGEIGEDNDALAAKLSASESRAQELETKLRAAEDAVVVLREVVEQAIKQNGCDMLLTGDEIREMARSISATSALAAQRKREIQREAVEAVLPARRSGEAYDLRSDGYQKGWNDCLDAINAAILGTTKPG